ncbi:MAG: nucleotide exchange factor GrpE [Clostridiales bacterium]|nr:nucleotide exchange factor GrpE [Clostridiales bacterium]
MNDTKSKVRYKLNQGEDWKDKYLRLAAEFDNHKKRTAREKSQVFTDATVDIVEKLLPVLDSIQSAQKMEIEGIEPIAQQIKEVFTKIGVSEIESLGKEFDPNLHNAVMHTEDESVGTNLIVEEFSKGYICNERVIRHSMVKVAN